MSDLVSISQSSEGAGDVIFVHGLGGDACDTWGFPDNSCWRACINIARPDLNIWSLSYRVDASEWAAGAMPLSDRAVNVLALLDIRLTEDRPIVFVCHSFGGLLVKELLRNAITTTPKYRKLATNVKLVVFFATPHSGSAVADLAKYLGFFLRDSIAVSDLTAQNLRLRDLNLWFRNNFGDLGLRTLIFYETLKTRGVHVVNESSADPGIAPITPIPIDANHLDIAKPKRFSDIAIGQTLKAIDDAVPSPKYQFRYDDISDVQPREAGTSGPSPLGLLSMRSVPWKTLGWGLVMIAAVASIGLALAWLFIPAAPREVNRLDMKAVLYTRDAQYVGATGLRTELMRPSPLAKAPFRQIAGVETPVNVESISIEIPKALTAKIEIHEAESYEEKNPDRPDEPPKVGGGSHLIVMRFHLPANFHGGEIKRINSLSTRRWETSSPIKVRTNKIWTDCEKPTVETCAPDSRLFYIYLSAGPNGKVYDNEPLAHAKFYEVSLDFADGQPGTLIIENYELFNLAYWLTH